MRERNKQGKGRLIRNLQCRRSASNVGSCEQEEAAKEAAAEIGEQSGEGEHGAGNLNSTGKFERYVARLTRRIIPCKSDKMQFTSSWSL